MFPSASLSATCLIFLSAMAGRSLTTVQDWSTRLSAVGVLTVSLRSNVASRSKLHGAAAPRPWRMPIWGLAIYALMWLGDAIRRREAVALQNGSTPRVSQLRQLGGTEPSLAWMLTSGPQESITSIGPYSSA